MRLPRDDQNSARTYGTLRDDDEGGTFVVQAPELPWLNDAVGRSCTAAGVYRMLLRFSAKHGHAVFGLNGDPNRTDEEVHAANIPAQLLGCIAPGIARAAFMRVLDFPPQDGVTLSQHAMDLFMANRGVPGYRELTSEALVAAFVAAHPEVASFTLTITDP